MAVLDVVSAVTVSTVAERFETVSIERLEAMDSVERDGLEFGVIGLTEAGDADIYNATESRLAGLRPERVIGHPFFMAVALCMNNFLVAQRLEDEPALDDTIDFVLTLRMRPTPVKLRMLKQPGISRRYILIQR
jgi:photoactive yellow protein